MKSVRSVSHSNAYFLPKCKRRLFVPGRQGYSPITGKKSKTGMGMEGNKVTQAKPSDHVKVHYTGKLEDGTVFDSSQGGEPLEFTIGGGQIIQGFEEGVVGMKPGESRTVAIPADRAYGTYKQEMVIVVERDEFPPEISPTLGDQLQMNTQDGQAFIVTVIDVTDTNVTLDANHPLAGKDLTFDIELVELED